MLSIISLGLSLKKLLPANPSKNAKTVSLLLQSTELMFNNICMLRITPLPLWDLPSLKLPISCYCSYQIYTRKVMAV